jgi:alkanesulfonate monooxygenase SsuD/methylene tetrahydromethanopterin reductase-like flavin-dependent oxidoreductase (luciferase family)
MSKIGKDQNHSGQNLKFGLAVSAQLVPFNDAISQCNYIEELGYDSIWVGDHFSNRIIQSDPFFDAWTTLAALAARTNRIRLGSLVTNFISRNPTLVARQALSVDHISNGRLELGLGAGVYPEDHSMAGVDFWQPRERVDRFRESIQIVDQMLQNEETSFEGVYYSIEGAILNPEPVQKPRPPITVAALGGRTIQIAAEFADCWNTLGLSIDMVRSGRTPSGNEALETVRKQGEILDRCCESLGRNRSEIRRSLLVGMMDDTPTESIDSFCDFVGRYQEIGINEFIFYWLTDEYRELLGERIQMLDRNMVELIATDGIPKLRR